MATFPRRTMSAALPTSGVWYFHRLWRCFQVRAFVFCSTNDFSVCSLLGSLNTPGLSSENTLLLPSAPDMCGSQFRGLASRQLSSTFREHQKE